MINPFQIGDQLTYHRTIATNDTAVFDTGAVHPVYATFALGRDAEWACRLFVLQMKESDEEGIGTYLHVQHHAPALPGDDVTFTATLKAIHQHEVICTFEAHVGNRKIASGETGQKIISKQKLEQLFNKLT